MPNSEKENATFFSLKPNETKEEFTSRVIAVFRGKGILKEPAIPAPRPKMTDDQIRRKYADMAISLGIELSPEDQTRMNDFIARSAGQPLPANQEPPSEAPATFLATEVDQELRELEADICKLQERAAILRRVRETPLDQFVAQSHARFVEVHRDFYLALNAFRIKIDALFQDLAAALGRSDKAKLAEWVAVRGGIGRLFHDAERSSDEFVADTMTAFLYDARKELEALFLELQGKHQDSSWFENILRKEGILEQEDGSKDGTQAEGDHESETHFEDGNADAIQEPCPPTSSPAVTVEENRELTQRLFREAGIELTPESSPQSPMVAVRFYNTPRTSDAPQPSEKSGS